MKHAAGQTCTKAANEGLNQASPVVGPTCVDATSRGKRIRRGAKLWTVAGSTFKAETYRFLRLPRPGGEELDVSARFPAGTIHLPAWIDSEWCKQRVGEQLVTVRTKRGFSRLEWRSCHRRYRVMCGRRVIAAAI